MSEALLDTIETYTGDEIFWEPSVEEKKTEGDRSDDLLRGEYRLLRMDEVLIPAVAFNDEEQSIVLPLLQPAERHLLHELTDVRTPAKWRLSGVLPPSVECRIKALEIAKLLLRGDEIIPRRIAPSVEGGIALTYKHPLFDRTMVLEIYNSLAAAGIVSEDQEVVYSEDIEDSELSSIVKIFWVGASKAAGSGSTDARRFRI